MELYFDDAKGGKKPARKRQGKKAHKILCPHCGFDLTGGASYTGAGFFDDFADGFMSVIRPVASVAKNVAGILPIPGAQAVSGVLGALGAGKKAKKPAKANDPRRIRGAKISAIMKKAKAAGRPLTLAQASKLLAKHK